MAGHVFLSYSRANKPYVEKLARRLNAEGVPFWFDQEATPGRSFGREIKERIEECAAFVLIMSDDAANSEYVEFELAWARRRRRPIIPLLLDGEIFMDVNHRQTEEVIGGKMPSAKFFVRLRQLVETAEIPDRPTFSGRELNKIDDPVGGSVLSVSWGADANVLLGGAEQSAEIWSAGPAAGKPLRLHGHHGSLWAVAWSPDGQQIATASADTTVRVWDATGKPRYELAAHGAEVLAVAWSTDGDRLVSGAEDGTAWIWDTNSGIALTALHNYRGAIRSLTWSPDGRYVVAAHDDHTVSLYNSHTGDPEVDLQAHTKMVQAVAWQPEGDHLASAGRDHVVRVWQPLGDEPPFELIGHDGSVWSVAWSPDGRFLASAGSDETVHIWEPFLETTTTKVLRGHSDRVWSVSWAPDGRRLASASADGTVLVWEVWK